MYLTHTMAALNYGMHIPPARNSRMLHRHNFGALWSSSEKKKSMPNWYMPGIARSWQVEA